MAPAQPTRLELLRQRVIRRVQYSYHLRYRQFAPPVLARRNSRSAASVLGDVPVTVSLTSHSTRVQTVHLTIESIGRGMVRPQRLILWLDDPATHADLPQPLRRLQQRGLEIRLTKNFGPHTKYYPYVISSDRGQLPLITVDDDILYPRWWLWAMWRSIRRGPDAIVVYRGRRVVLVDGQFADYAGWPVCETDRPSLANFVTGVSGAYYPAVALDALLEQGDRFTSITPKADDIWLSWVALRHDLTVRQVFRLGQHFPALPGSQDIGLFNENVDAGRNDAYLAATYDDTDRSRLQAVLAAESATDGPADR